VRLCVCVCVWVWVCPPHPSRQREDALMERLSQREDTHKQQRQDDAHAEDMRALAAKHAVELECVDRRTGMGGMGMGGAGTLLRSPLRWSFSSPWCRPVLLAHVFCLGCARRMGRDVVSCNRELNARLAKVTKRAARATQALQEAQADNARLKSQLEAAVVRDCEALAVRATAPTPFSARNVGATSHLRGAIRSIMCERCECLRAGECDNRCTGCRPQ
jgi:hypothetical protein